MDRDTLSVLNDLLQCELSAIRTCRHALERLDGGEVEPAVLRRLATDHRAAADSWGEAVRQRGGEPARSPGVWGAWTEAVEGTSDVVGSVAELNALRQEEENLVRRYEEALAKGPLDDESATSIRERWLPQTKEHCELIGVSA